jgi:hypothetical protein
MTRQVCRLSEVYKEKKEMEDPVRGTTFTIIIIIIIIITVKMKLYCSGGSQAMPALPSGRVASKRPSIGK